VIKTHELRDLVQTDAGCVGCADSAQVAFVIVRLTPEETLPQKLWGTKFQGPAVGFIDWLDALCESRAEFDLQKLPPRIQAPGRFNRSFKRQRRQDQVYVIYRRDNCHRHIFPCLLQNLGEAVWIIDFVVLADQKAKRLMHVAEIGEIVFVRPKVGFQRIGIFRGQNCLCVFAHGKAEDWERIEGS